MRNVCSVDGCEAYVVGRGLCRRHYSRAYRGKPVGSADKLKPGPPRHYCRECPEPVVAQGLCALHYRREVLGPKRKAALLATKSGRLCMRCGEEIPATRKADSLFCSRACKTRSSNERTTQSTANAERLRAHLYAKNFGITIADYDRMLDEQNGGCAICGVEPGHTRLSVDHCHAGGHVRGLLCQACNLGLGKFKDSVDSLRAAIAYLERSP